MIIEENLNRDNIENEFNDDENEYLSDLDEDFYEYYPYNESFGINDESNYSWESFGTAIRKG